LAAEFMNLPLVAIKVIHTLVWALLMGCILLLPVAAMARRFDWALLFMGIVLVECGVLAINRCKCPLTVVAEKYTSNRADNFDIYLPRWMARNNLKVSGALCLVGIIMVLWRWMTAH
jgi:hypothetical protein